MLEVCFSDSVKGALSVAQHCENRSLGGAIGVITDKKWPFSFFAKRKAIKEYKEKRARLQKQAVSLGGKRADLVGISFGLSEGDIRAPIGLPDCPRKAYIHDTFSFDRYNECEDMEASIDHFWLRCIDDLQKLKSASGRIRVWVDQTPDAQCGLLFVADLLADSGAELRVVDLPAQIKREDGSAAVYRGWGEVEPELFGTFLDRERALGQSERQQLSQQWQKLVQQNASLRVVEDGVVVSADESYYDDLIRKEFPRESCKVANIIGCALGKQSILTGDVFIAKRIQRFIDTGELVVLGSTKNGLYSTVVCCAK